MFQIGRTVYTDENSKSFDSTTIETTYYFKTPFTGIVCNRCIWYGKRKYLVQFLILLIVAVGLLIFATLQNVIVHSIMHWISGILGYVILVPMISNLYYSFRTKRTIGDEILKNKFWPVFKQLGIDQCTTRKEFYYHSFLEKTDSPLVWLWSILTFFHFSVPYTLHESALQKKGDKEYLASINKNCPKCDIDLKNVKVNKIENGLYTPNQQLFNLKIVQDFILENCNIKVDNFNDIHFDIWLCEDCNYEKYMYNEYIKNATVRCFLIETNH